MSYTQVPPNSTGNKIDTVQLTDGSDVVQRQVTVNGDPTDALAISKVTKSIAPNDSYASVTTQKPTVKWKWSFADTVSNSVSSDMGVVMQTGSGMTVNQTGGSLLITTGTTGIVETVIRSVEKFKGTGQFRYSLTLSQRIANQTFVIELVDVLGDGLAFTINSSTSVSVTLPAHGFAAKDIGKSIQIGVWSGVSNLTTGSYAIASLPDANTISFTVSGFPGSGSGTCSLFGYNYHQIVYNGTTATSLSGGFITARKGRANAAQGATISSTAAPGHVGFIDIRDNRVSQYLDASTFTTTFTNRTSQIQNVPDSDTELYLQIRVINNSVPASTTTLTMGFVDWESFHYVPVEISGIRPNGFQGEIPVRLNSVGVTVGVNGTVNTIGAAAHDAAISGNPVRTSGRALTANYTAVQTGDTADIVTTLVGAQIIKPYSIPEADWLYAAASGGIVDTTDVAVKAASGAGIRNYITGVSIKNAHAAVGTEVVIKDGSTVIWRMYFAAGDREDTYFTTPLKGTANTAINVACITTGSAVYVNLQGYIAP